MSHQEVEAVEQTTLSMVVRALTDYFPQAVQIFREETDLPQDIAEDVTREALQAMGLPGIRERLYGKVDVKKAMYVFLPEAHPVALMLDAKAEKPDGDRSATIQMSQTSMIVRMRRAGATTEERGKLSTTIERSGKRFLVVTIIAKYVYTPIVDSPAANLLERIIVACIPNGQLQAIYNPSVDDTIWLAGRNAPSRGEDFRVRLGFRKLQEKAPWRVHTITHPESTGSEVSGQTR